MLSLYKALDPFLVLQNPLISRGEIKFFVVLKAPREMLTHRGVGHYV